MYPKKHRTSEVIKYYNQGSKINDVSKVTSSYKKYLQAEEKFLKKTIPEKARVLEIGAGDGRIIDSLNNGKRKITGIEIANLSFLKNKYKGNKNIKINKMDAHKLLFKNKSFDVCIIMYNSLGLMNNPLKVLKECKRVVNKKGQIILSTYTIDAEYALKERIKCFRKIAHKITKRDGFDFEVDHGIASHYFTIKELKTIFKKANVKPVYQPLSKLGCVWIITF